MRNTENVACAPCEPRVRLKERISRTGEMLDEALKITAEISAKIYGLDVNDAKRPEANCMQKDLEITEAGMGSLVCMLKEILDGLC